MKEKAMANSCFCLDRAQKTHGKDQDVNLKVAIPLRYITSIVQIYIILSILISGPLLCGLKFETEIFRI